MPKWIGNGKRAGVTEFQADDDLTAFIRVTYSQQLQFAPSDVRVALDDTDKGGPKSYAKRWWRWYVRRACITPQHSESLRRRAAEGCGGIKGYAACRLRHAINAATVAGDDWDAPEAAEARETTRTLGISWEFTDWAAAADSLNRCGRLGFHVVNGAYVPYVLEG